MTGIVGGRATGRELSEMAETMYREDWYETRRREAGDRGLALVEHGTRDVRANTVWQGDRGAGVVHGVVSNRERLGYTTGELFERFLDRPGSVLEELEGPFAIAAIDRREERIRLATDKGGSRPIYYGADDPFRFGSEVTPIVRSRTDATVDPQAVGDLLTYGFVVGDRTVLREVSNLPPATVLTADADGVRTRRYWTPDLGPLDSASYPDRWISQYRRATGDVASSVDALTLWLSGGLDSRIAAATLSEVDCPFDALTYEGTTGNDHGPAGQVAEALDVDQRFVGLGETDGLIEAIRRGVDVTDGMTQWAAFANLPFMFDGLHDSADVVMEGGTFLGEDLWHSHLLEADTAVDALYRRKSQLPAETVDGVVDPGYDPRASLRVEVDRSVGHTSDRQALDAIRRLYAYSHMRSNIVQRSQVGTRVVSHGDMLDCAIRMPHSYRMRTIPLTRGSIPEGVTRIKLAVVRRLNRGLDEIPYDRTGLSPARPLWMHTIGFGGKQVADAVSTTDRPYVDRYRADPTFRQWLDGLIDDVRDRPYLDDDAVETLRSRFAEGETGLFPRIAALSGLELWQRQRLDPVRRRGLARV